MKKLETKRLKHRLHAASKRLGREKRSKGFRTVADAPPITLKPSSRSIGTKTELPNPRVNVPHILDLYSKENFELFANFILNLRLAVKYNDRVIICFKNTNQVTAAAALRLLAEVSHLLFLHSHISFGCSTQTRRKGKFRNTDTVIDEILQQIGFFAAIGQPGRATSTQADIKVWRQLSGNLADGSLAASLLDCLPATISKKSKAQLYKGAIEAMANSVDHAYPARENDNQLVENRWWMLVGTKEERITLIVCDLGVGIPVTLPKKHPETMLQSIFKSIGIMGHGDADMIHASTFIKRSRTNQTHRGKGGADIRSITEHFPTALLSIRSNRGCYVVSGPNRTRKAGKDYTAIPGTNGLEWSASYDGSIHGTMIEWTVSLKELEE